MDISPPTKTPPATRDVTINIRAQKAQRDLIDQAAAVQGKTRSEFMLQCAYQQAQSVLLDQCFFNLEADAFQALTATLDAPPQSHQGLRQLLATPSPWE